MVVSRNISSIQKFRLFSYLVSWWYLVPCFYVDRGGTDKTLSRERHLRGALRAYRACSGHQSLLSTMRRLKITVLRLLSISFYLIRPMCPNKMSHNPPDTGDTVRARWTRLIKSCILILKTNKRVRLQQDTPCESACHWPCKATACSTGTQHRIHLLSRDTYMYNC